MKIKVIGKAHFAGTSKKTGKPYDFNQLHYIGKARGASCFAFVPHQLPRRESAGVGKGQYYPLPAIRIQFRFR